MSFSSVLLALLDANSAYYKMTEASGTTMSDSSGNGRDGTYSGTYTLGQTGLISGEADTSVLFGGAVVGVSHASWMDQSTRGVGCLFTHSSTSATRYLCGRFTSGTNQYLSIDLTSGGTLRCYAFISGTQRLISAVAPSINNGATHMVFGCYDGTTLSLYYDGSLLTSGTWSGTLSATSTAGLQIGGRGDGTEAWDDRIEKTWFSPVLTSTQVSSLWAQVTAGAGTNVTVTPPAMSATAAVLVPTITTTRSVTVLPPKMTATAALAVPTVTAAKSVTVSPPAMTATATMLVPAVVVGGNITIQPPPMAAAATLLAPSVSAQRIVTIAPPVMAATADLLVPTIVISGAGDITIDAPTMTAAASLVRPIIITNVSRPVDDNLANAGALVMTGWSTVSYNVDPPGGDRADLAAVHVEPV